MRRWLLLAVGAFACASGRELPRAGDILIADAEVRVAPAAATSAAAYWTLRHLGTVPDTLLSVVAAGAEASVHQSVERDGLRTMQPVAELEVAPGRGTRFEPGGLHVMLERFEPPPAVGDTIRITLEFARGGSVTFAAPVRPVGGDD